MEKVPQTEVTSLKDENMQVGDNSTIVTSDAIAAKESDTPEERTLELWHQAVKNNDAEMLGRLLRDFRETFEEEYPWIYDVRNQEDMEDAQIIDLLLKSEHLQWVRLGDVQQRSEDPPMESNAVEIPGHHQALCSRGLIKRLFTPDAAPDDTASLSSDDSWSFPTAIENPEFKESYARLRRLGGRQNHILRICGIAGVSPPTDDDEGLCEGSAPFSGSTAHITYANSSYKATAAIVSRAFDKFLAALGALQADGACCDRVTMIFQSTSVSHLAGLHTLDVETVHRFKVLLDWYATSLDTADPIEALAYLCQQVLTNWNWATLFRLEAFSDDAMCLHLASLIAQIGCLGAVLYGQGHGRVFEHPRLSRDIRTFVLEGSDVAGAKVYVKPTGLGFPGCMFGEALWIFSSSEPPQNNSDVQKLYLATSIDDLIDTWGGAVFVQEVDTEHEQAEVKIRVGVGSLTRAEVQNGDLPDFAPLAGSIHCRWIEDREGLMKLKKDDETLIIGGSILAPFGAEQLSPEASDDED